MSESSLGGDLRGLGLGCDGGQFERARGCGCV